MFQAAIKQERRLKALALSRGIGIGRVVFLHGEKRQFFRIDLNDNEVDTEIVRLRGAVAQAVHQLHELSNKNPDRMQATSSIFGVHRLIIEESSLIENIEAAIKDDKVNAEWALKVVTDKYVEKQLAVADGSFREKHLDIEDVADRLMNALVGSPSRAQLTYSGAVVVARELRPSAIVELAKSKPAALITERGGWTSHTSILARELMLPMVSGIKNLAQVFGHGDQVIVDATEGQIVISASVETVEYFQGVSHENSTNIASPPIFEKVLTTLDGTEIEIRANVDLPEGYGYARKLGARGIGLFRSESVIGNLGAMPSEDDQLSVYSQIADTAGDDGVRIRTFDIGPNHFRGSDFFEGNPALGLRSIRLSLTETSDFRTQIRAILRSGVNRKIDIVLPMVSGVGEIERSRTILDEESEKLIQAGIAIGKPKLGAMIEIPSAVLTAREIAQKVDFFCLGTNDLVQYLLAVDRDNDAVADWYQTLHPAVIRAIAKVLAAATSVAIPVAVCGEMAGSPFYVPVLIGLGARELSMNVNSIAQVRHLIAGITVNECVALVERIKPSETADETEHLLREAYLKNWNSLFPPGLLNTKHR